MPRKSRREIERDLEGMSSGGEHGIQAYLWANLKDYYDGDLSPDERALLAHPERNLSAEAQARIQRGEGQ